MAKKRKSTKPSGREDEEPSKLVINSWEDVADSGDEFHMNRDKILLDEGPSRKRRRQLEEDCKRMHFPGFTQANAS
jgi:U3 small nucleolar RNA-associated protein 3